MAKFNILHWLYKHSPVNFYSVSSDGETIIKSINNTSVGYKFNNEFSQESIDNLRKVIKNLKRFLTLSILFSYIFILYLIIFPNYLFFSDSNWKIFLVFGIIIAVTLFIAFVHSKFFEFYLIKNYGRFEKVHFPSSDSIEHQSYKEFKLELSKIFTLILVLCGVYLWIGSPSQTCLNMIYKYRYSDVIKITTLWSKILPIDSTWYSLRAYAKFKTGDFEGAIQDYDKAYSLENDVFKSMNFDNKIYVKYFMEDYAGALSDFDKEIEKADDDYEKDAFLWDKAQFLYNIKNYKQALKIYDILIENSENDLIYLIQNKLYYERGLVYLKLNKKKEAKKDFDKADELDLEDAFKKDIPEPVLLLDDMDENI